MTQSDLADTFRQEARDVLEQLEQALLDLGDALDDMSLVDSAFRALHTLKGSGAMFGFTEVADFVHEFETAFDRVRKGSATPSADLVHVALAAKDHIATLVAEPGAHAEAGAPILEKLRAVVKPGEVADSPGPNLVVGESDADPNGQPDGWRIRFRLSEDALSLGANPVLLLDDLRDLGPCDIVANASALPALEDLDPEVSYLEWQINLNAACPRASIDDVFLFVSDGTDIEIAPLAAEESTPALAAGAERDVTGAPADRPPQIASQRPVKTEIREKNMSLRVAAERLDELLDRVGELVIAQARLSQIASDSENTGLKAVTEEIERLAAGLRDTTMNIRMVPIGSLFGRFRRLVHDLAGDLGKDIDFVTSGEDTELDKTVVERLADPLVHVIRNSIDHGLENADRRIAAGKDPRGVVRISAMHQGAEVAIEIADDGAGLDTDRIRQKAEEAGLVAPGAVLSDHDVHQFIFHPGFSTAREVTAISGRGVGMDVVSRTMESLRGRIDIASRPGEGSTVTLRLPLTLAIIEGMLVRVGRNCYAIPLSAVEECVELPIEAARDTRGRNFLSLRDSLVPFLRLRELFSVEAPADLHQKVVIVSTGDQRVGLVVDQIIGNAQTVIKSLSRLHADIESFAGATILADGTVALILDVAHLLRAGQRLERRLRNHREEEVA